MKPIIGITLECEHDPDNPTTKGRMYLNWNYPEAISLAGGLPILIPPTADMSEIAKLIDGWLVPGGKDMDASRFGEENHPDVQLQDEHRFDAEAALLSFVDAELPILGVCYGCQFLNVACGGTLEQHLPDRLGHNDHTTGREEAIEVEERTLLSAVVKGSQVKGKSFHHQSVCRVGDGLIASARHEDGTVEAVESTNGRWMIGVQWHPERSLDDPQNRALFEAFVKAASEFRRKKQA